MAPCFLDRWDTYLGKSAKEPPSASLIGLVGLFGFWLVPDQVPTIGDTSTIITHFKTWGGGSRRGWCGKERKADMLDWMTQPSRHASCDLFVTLACNRV